MTKLTLFFLALGLTACGNGQNLPANTAHTYSVQFSGSNAQYQLIMHGNASNGYAANFTFDPLSLTDGDPSDDVTATLGAGSTQVKQVQGDNAEIYLGNMKPEISISYVVYKDGTQVDAGTLDTSTPTLDHVYQ